MSVTLWRAVVLPEGSDPNVVFEGSGRSGFSHWTWDKDWAEWFANELATSNYGPDNRRLDNLVRVVVEAEVSEADIVNDETVINRLRGGFDLPEPEVVLQAGATVIVKALLVQDAEFESIYHRRPVNRSWTI